MTDYASFGERLLATGVLTDPFYDGAPRFRPEPVRLTNERHRAVCIAAAGIARVHDELARIVAAAPDLATSWFGLTPWQLGMWRCSAPEWHGIARADVFFTAHGPVVCELNSDTPSGEAEAVLVGGLRDPEPGTFDPSAVLPERFAAMVEAFGAHAKDTNSLVVGLLYPTDLPEDLSMVAVYTHWLERRGHRVVLGSPCNVGLSPCGRATLFDTPCDIVVRHYKTDWFGERIPCWRDEPPPDDVEPIREPLLRLLAASVERRTAVVNPFGAVLTQNKLALAFCHEQIERFSPAAQNAIRRFLPRTLRLDLVRSAVREDQDGWVLKSDYGCEGAEVVVGRHVDRATWLDAIDRAVPGRFVAQRWFEAERDAHGHVVNHGVYVVGGRPSGLLARVDVADAITGPGSCIAPVLVEQETAS